MDLHQRILITALNSFFKMGVRSVTLDQLVSELGISKKTIYQHFKDKSDLVLEAAKFRLQMEREMARAVKEESENAIQEAIMMAQIVRSTFIEMHPNFMAELKKYYPEAWHVYEQSKATFVQIIQENLLSGQKEGLYREGMDVEILSRFRIETIEIILNGGVFSPSEYNFLHIQDMLFDHFMKGILTQKGLELFTQLIEVDFNIKEILNCN